MKPYQTKHTCIKVFFGSKHGILMRNKLAKHTLLLSTTLHTILNKNLVILICVYFMVFLGLPSTVTNLRIAYSSSSSQRRIFFQSL